MSATEPKPYNRTEETPHWYVLTVLRSSLQACEQLAAHADEFNARSAARLECFAPTFVDVTARDNGRGRIRKPLLYNYIFIRGTLPQLRRFHNSYPAYNLIPTGEKREAPTDYRYVPDDEMTQFMRIAQAYEHAVPCFSPSEIDLEQGDRVRIVGGQFSGVEGVLLSQKGRDGGRVIVRITDMLAVETLDIAPQYLQIVEFAKGGKHVYDKIESYLPKARRALANSLLRKGPDASDLAAVNYFLTRYGQVSLPPASKIRGKYTALLMLSHRVLGRTNEYERCKQEYLEFLPQITNPETRAMTLGMLYACTAEPRWLHEARALADQWLGSEEQPNAARRAILEDLALYEKAIAAQR